MPSRECATIADWLAWLASAAPFASATIPAPWSRIGTARPMTSPTCTSLTIIANALRIGDHLIERLGAVDRASTDSGESAGMLAMASV